MSTKRVVAMFDIETGPDGQTWTKQDIACWLEDHGGNATVWDSLEEFDADRAEGVGEFAR